MAFEGYIDHTSATEVSGWVYDNTYADLALDIEILDGDLVIANVCAKQFREDLAACGKGNGKHAFSFKAGKPAAAPLGARIAGKRWRIPPSGGSTAARQLPMRFDAQLLHSLEYGLPAAVAQQGFSPIPAVIQDPALGHRLIRAYERAVTDDPAAQNRKNDQWTVVENSQHGKVLALLQHHDVAELMRYLQTAHAQGITYGITQGEHVTNVLQTNPDARRLVMLQVLDHLTSLAEFLDAMDVECPDQHGQWGENLHRDPLATLELIRTVLGIEVVPPQVMGFAFGLSTPQGILATRDILSLYAALRIKAITPSIEGTASGSVCEIGGGLGGAAYYANRLGIAQYTIIDLPVISLLQGYYLLSALPDAKIQLYGEDMPDARIRLLPTFAFAHEPSPFDLLFNQDSMPEMHPDYSIQYLKDAQAKKISQFLSINQEARGTESPTTLQRVVRELVAQAGGYQRQYRFRHWIRAGYVEELFSLTS